MIRESLALVVIACMACGPRSPRPHGDDVPWASAGIDWSRPPAAVPTPFTPPPVEIVTLDNGLRLAFVESSQLPIVTVTAIVSRAGSREDGATPGVAALTADVLDEIARENDASGIDVLDRSGMRLETTIATDHASFQITSSEPRSAIEALQKILAKPIITDAVVARVRSRRIVELAERRTRARTVAAQVFDRVLFGEHPYARPAEGTADDVAKLTASDVVRFWHEAYGPNRTTIVLAGRVSRTGYERVFATELGAWRRNDRPSAVVPMLGSYERRLAVVDRPAAENVVVLIGGRGPTIASPDRLAGDVASSILGGGIGSRLDRKLHDELAVTLGAGSSFWRGEWAGSWTVATTFRTDSALHALHATLDVIESARTTAPSDAELARARENLLRAATLMFETAAGTARAAERVATQPLPLTWYATYEARLAAITPAAVQAAIASVWADPSIVVVGDWSKLGPELESLGLPIVKYASDGTRAP